MHLAPKPLQLPMAALLCACWALALYAFTLAPTFGWGDSADLAIRMLIADDRTFSNSTRHYALYRAIGSVFQHLPFGDAGTRANFMTAFFGAVSVGIIAFLTGYLTRSLFSAYAAGIALAVSHTFWLMSVIAEVYSFNSVLIFGCYSALAIWWRSARPLAFVIAAAFAGLALNHHPSGLVLCATIAPLVLMRLRQLRWWLVVAACLAFAATSFPYWQHVWQHFDATTPLLRTLGLQAPSNPFFDVSPLRELAKFLAYVCYNYAGFGVLLALWGSVILLRNKTAEMLPPALWVLLMVSGGIFSSIPDKFNIYVLVYPVIAIAVGVGAARAKERFLKTNLKASLLLVALAILPPLGYITAIHTAQHFKLDLVGARSMPYRDNDHYFMWPGKRGDVGPRRYAEEALTAAKPNAILIADYSLWRPLYALQAIEGVRRDVKLLWVEPLTWRGSVASYIAQAPCTQPLYLATDTPAEYYQLREVEKRWPLEKRGVVVEVSGRCKS